MYLMKRIKIILCVDERSAQWKKKIKSPVLFLSIVVVQARWFPDSFFGWFHLLHFSEYQKQNKNKAKAHISGESEVHRGKNISENAADYGRFTLDFNPIGLLVTVIGPTAGENQL